MVLQRILSEVIMSHVYNACPVISPIRIISHPPVFSTFTLNIIVTMYVFYSFRNHWPAHKALCKQAKAQNELSAKIQEEYEGWHLRSKDLFKSFCVSTLDESKVEGHVILLDMKRIQQGATHFKFEIFNAESVSNER